MKLLICGDRNWKYKWAIERHIDSLLAAGHELIIIEGEAKGADQIAANIAIEKGIQLFPFPANWEKYGKAAGVIRNQQMLEENPDQVIGFHNDIMKSKGTKDMLLRAYKAKIPAFLAMADKDFMEIYSWEDILAGKHRK